MSVLVYIENWDGNLKKSSFELASYAAGLAAMLNTDPVAVSIGDVSEGEFSELGRFGLKRIIAVQHDSLKQFDSRAYAGVLASLAIEMNATVVLLANNNTGKSVAPRLAVRLKAAIASGVNGLPVSVDPFIVSKKVFSGNAFAQMEMKTPAKVLTLSQNSFELAEKPVASEIISRNIAPEVPAAGIHMKEVQKLTGKVLLSDAEIVVSGGRGMKSPGNWGPLLEFADLLSAATACSRPVSDEGWRPHEEHTGQTGKIIAPNLYFAVGISGATQHLAGISSSKYIVAINTDKDAPIFEAAQYGIVGDAAKVLPKLVEAVKSIKQ